MKKYPRYMFMALIAMLLILALPGCDQSGDDDGAAPPPSSGRYENVEDLADLADLVTTGKAYTVILGSSVNISESWGDINAAILQAKKRVILDLSVCAAEDNLIEGNSGTPGGNDFNIIRDNPYITGIILPQSLELIDVYAFTGCASLVSVVLPDGLLGIGNYAFRGLSGLKNITIPDSVTYIGTYAFSNCTGLTSIAIPYGFTTIEANCFNGCTGLTSFSIPDTVTTIGAAAFSGCTGLSGSLVIPASVTDLQAFGGCTNITEVVFPARDAPVIIRLNCFNGCTALTSVVFEDANATIVADNSFPNGASLKTAYEGEGGGAGTYTLSAGSWSKN
jgi:hypothetical protein